VRGDERRVVDALCDCLQSEGSVGLRREVGFVDVIAERDGQTMYAEAKGRTAAIGLDVDAMYGQILRRMPLDEDPSHRFAVVVPDEALAAALPRARASSTSAPDRDLRREQVRQRPPTRLSASRAADGSPPSHGP
jgi:hypothetical protein